MFDGELLQIGAPLQIYDDPTDRRVAEFIGSPKINMLTGVVREPGLVDIAGSTLTLDVGLGPGTPITLGIRPEALHVADGAGAGALTGTVRLVEHLGSDLFAHVEMMGLPELIIARLHVERAPELRIGRTLHLAVHPELVMQFDGDGRRIRTAHNNITPLRSYG
jgi:multiple sugar transport system ATP-binding protein